MTLDSHQYNDPCRVLERKQEEAQRKERACGDCVHKRTIELSSEVVHFCSFKRYQYGRRCDQYQFKKGGK